MSGGPGRPQTEGEGVPLPGAPAEGRMPREAHPRGVARAPVWWLIVASPGAGAQPGDPGVARGVWGCGGRKRGLAGPGRGGAGRFPWQAAALPLWKSCCSARPGSGCAARQPSLPFAFLRTPCLAFSVLGEPGSFAEVSRESQFLSPPSRKSSRRSSCGTQQRERESFGHLDGSPGSRRDPPSLLSARASFFSLAPSLFLQGWRRPRPIAPSPLPKPNVGWR